MLSRITDFEIKFLNINDLPTEIFTFASKCKAQGLKNNQSIEAMKIGKWGNEAWWYTQIQNEIASISACHSFDDYEKDCWRLMVRTATLREYRGKAPGSLRKMHNDFNWGHILPYQIDYAKNQGAKRLIFTTNSDSDGESNSLRTNRAVSRAFEPQGLAKLIEKDVTIFFTKQNVWEILI